MTKEEHQKALNKILELMEMEIPQGSDLEKELLELVELVEKYEEKFFK